MEVSVGGETITATPEHPFYVAQKGFIKAMKLRAGDILCTVNGEYVIIEQVQHEILESPVQVYNFKVANYHTYYVGYVSVGVHNAKCGGTEGSGKTEENNPGNGGKFGIAKDYGIDIENLNFSDTVKGHIDRPYQDFKLLINEIIESAIPKPDPQGTSAWYWEVEGSYNGSDGVYELLIDPKSNSVWHFMYKSKK